MQMSAHKFLILSFLQWVLFILLKTWVFHYKIFSTSGMEGIVFWSATIVITAALVRRLGVINYMEAIFIMFLWTIADAFSDLVITSVITGLDIFSNPNYWYGLGIMNVVIFLVHKKRHVHVRNELHAKSHGHAPHGHEHKKH